MQRTSDFSPRIAIIGSGFSGLCLGIQLKQAGFEDFVLLEKSDRLGGTWRDNTYPGAACDVPSFSYCYSFEQKVDWSRKWSPQPEILAYMEHCASKYGLEPHIRYGARVSAAEFDDSAGRWHIDIEGSDSIETEVLVSGVGQLHKPYTPDIPGLSSFAGDRFHSARWNHDVSLEGKRVAVIGNAASALQFIPQIAPACGQLAVFQRTPNWVMPRNDRAYTDAEKQRFARHPILARLYRWYIWALLESRFPLLRGNRLLERGVRKYAKDHLRAQIPDARMRRQLTPDYPPGGKRLLISDDYYPALARDNVSLITEPIEEVVADGIRTRDGQHVAADVLILATGFDTTHFLSPVDLNGLGGTSLQATWETGARAYLGLAVPNFPNFFLVYGPNTNLGHNSIIFMIECQTNYIVQCIERLQKRNLRYLDLDRDAFEEYNRALQEELAETVWAKTEDSWYKRSDGLITNNWSSTTTRYWWKTRRPNWNHYREVARAQEVTEPQPLRAEVGARA